MSTLVSPYEVVLDPAAYAGIHLCEDDGVPMDTLWHRYCMDLLIELTFVLNSDRDDFMVGGNNFIYFNPQQARNLDYRGPDYFYIKDGVVDPARVRKYWLAWEENGRLPDVIIELISPSTEHTDRTTKYAIYEQSFCTAEYFLYNPEGFVLEGFRLVEGSYQPIQPDERGWLWSEQLGVWIGNWTGLYRMRSTWLRFYTETGDLVPREADAERLRAGQERKKARAEREKTRAEREKTQKEKERADQAEQEVARLRALLAKKGDSAKPNGAGAS